MVKEALAAKSLKFLFSETVLDIVRCIFWWYGRGLKSAWQSMLDFAAQGNAELALSVWIKNIFTPMFGQYDWQGRLVSFIVRLFQIILRAFGFAVWLLVGWLVFLFWIFLPILLLILIIYNTGLIEVTGI